VTTLSIFWDGVKPMKSLSFAKCAAGVAVALALSPAAFAQSFTASNTTAVINTVDHVATITLNTGGAAASGVELTVTYDNANIALPAAAAPHPEITVSTADLSCGVSTVGTIICGGFAGAWPATSTVQIRFDVGGTAVPAPGSPITIAGRFLDTNGDPIVTTLANGSVTIITAPPDVTLSYAPAAGSTIAFPAGVALTTSNSSITVTGGGTVGSGTVTSCGITGAGAGAFGAPPTNITVAAGATGTLPLSCTLPNSGGAATATLTCTETDSDTPAPGAQRSWTLNCPQGTPVPGPGYSSAPPAGTTLNCDGAPGSATQTTFNVTNNGNPGAGSELTFACTAAGAGFSIISGGTTTAPGLAVGASQVVTVGCTAAAEGAPANTGTVTCTTNAGTTATYPLSAVGVTVPAPLPRAAIVPAGSTWSYAALIALLAGFGIALVGFRRNH
jgi:hypothetical protein